jgi:hypothetical protein
LVVLALNHSAARAGVIVCTLLRTVTAPLASSVHTELGLMRIMMARREARTARLDD